jgi:hypothetical protein
MNKSLTAGAHGYVLLRAQSKGPQGQGRRPESLKRARRCDSLGLPLSVGRFVNASRQEARRHGVQKAFCGATVRDGPRPFKDGVEEGDAESIASNYSPRGA